MMVNRMNYRLTYSGPTGFNYKGFETQIDAIQWAMNKANMGLIVPLELKKYSKRSDSFITIGNFTENR